MIDNLAVIIKQDITCLYSHWYRHKNQEENCNKKIDKSQQSKDININQNYNTNKACKNLLIFTLIFKS